MQKLVVTKKKVLYFSEYKVSNEIDSDKSSKCII